MRRIELIQVLIVTSGFLLVCNAYDIKGLAVRFVYKRVR
jgi:hypothetical protein